MSARKARARIFQALMIFSLAVSMGVLIWLLISTFIDGIPALDSKLFTNPPSSVPEEAGARPAILATLYIAVLVLLFSVPIGVGTAIYMEEYAKKERWYNRFLEVNIQNLAAVPAIVYGILGLAFIVRGIGVGRVLLAGALILTLVVLPTVIIASREALRAVPDSIRQGGYALGATKWQVISQAGPAGLDSGYRDGLDPRAFARSRRDGAPSAHRGIDVRRVRPDDPRPVHRPPGADLHLGEVARRRVPGTRGSRDHRPARNRARHERCRDLPAHQVSPEVVVPLDLRVKPPRVQNPYPFSPDGNRSDTSRYPIATVFCRSMSTDDRKSIAREMGNT